MNTKTCAIIILVLGIILSSCRQGESITDGFVEYNSTESINQYGFSDQVPVFTVKYPSEWTYYWMSDSGATVLMISSGDVTAIEDPSVATLMIVPTQYSGENLTDLLYGMGSIVEEPSTITINGQDAVKAEFIDDEQKQIELVIVRDKWVLNVVAFFPIKQEMEFRPLLEAMISTIEIK